MMKDESDPSSKEPSVYKRSNQATGQLLASSAFPLTTAINTVTGSGSILLLLDQLIMLAVGMYSLNLKARKQVSRPVNYRRQYFASIKGVVRDF